MTILSGNLQQTWYWRYLPVLAQYWRNFGMITPFSTDLQHYYSTVLVLNDNTGGVLAEYWQSTGGVRASQVSVVTTGRGQNLERRNIERPIF